MLTKFSNMTDEEFSTFPHVLQPSISTSGRLSKGQEYTFVMKRITIILSALAKKEGTQMVTNRMINKLWYYIQCYTA